MSEHLFHKADLRAVLEHQSAKMTAEIDALSENRLLNTPVDDLYNYFVQKYAVEPPVLDEAGIQADYGSTKVDVSGRFDYAVFDRTTPTYVTGTRLTFYVPFTGDANLFKCRPSTFNYNPPRADVRGNELEIVFERTVSDAPNIEAEFKRELKNIKEYLEWIARDVGQFNSSLPATAKQRIEWRREKVLKDRSLVEKIGFPMRRREGVPQTYVAPQVKRKIEPKLPPASAKPFSPEPTLDNAEYEHILKVISNMVLVMERSPQAFRGMKEEDLRQHFLVQLNGHYEGQATGETFNYQGKTDILIRVEGRNIFVAECKFWGGPEELKKALGQLLGYVTWRDGKLALLVFNRERALSTVLARIPEVLKAHPNFKRQVEFKSETGFRFVFGHSDDANREFILTVMVFEVPT